MGGRKDRLGKRRQEGREIQGWLRGITCGNINRRRGTVWSDDGESVEASEGVMVLLKGKGDTKVTVRR